jgi:PIN domain nuclease of toxin-antitoxin system
MLLDSTPIVHLPNDEDLLAAGGLQAIKSASSLSISIASVWELEIKQGLKKVRLAPNVWDWFAERGVAFLPIEIEDATVAASLPLHHRDPFDRMIIAQAKRRNMPIVTRDRMFVAYGVPVIWA